MKTTKRTMAIACVVLALAMARQPKAEAQSTWGAWESTGVGISIRFARVNNNTLTWAFRNDTNQNLTSMDFNYSFVDADSGEETTQHDILPYTLRPGGSVGGWTCYSANTRGSVSIAIQHYQFGR
jgi:hypothetical protein